MSFLLCLVLVFAILSLGVVIQLVRSIIRFAFEIVTLAVRLVLDIVHLVFWLVFAIVNNLASILALAVTVVAAVVSRIASIIESWIDDGPSRRRPVKSHQEIDLAPSNVGPRPRIAPVSAMIWCWIAPTFVLGTFVLLSDAANNPLDRTMAWARSRLFNQPKLWEQQISRDQLVPTVWTVPVQTSDNSGQRPEWTSRIRTRIGDIENIVVSSHLWSTEAEATAELHPQVARLVKADFELNHHGILDPKGKLPISDDQVARIAVTDRYLERTEQNFGSFDAPMYRMWYQVQLSPIVRTELYPSWKAAASKNRIIALGAGLAMLVLIANLIWMGAKLRSSGNHGRVYVASLATLSAVAWTALSASAIRQLMS